MDLLYAINVSKTSTCSMMAEKDSYGECDTIDLGKKYSVPFKM